MVLGDGFILWRLFLPNQSSSALKSALWLYENVVLGLPLRPRGLCLGACEGMFRTGRVCLWWLLDSMVARCF